MEIETFIQHFENAIEGITPGTVKPQTPLRTLPQWDSLALLNILAMIDIEYGVQATGMEIQNSKTIQDLFALVQRKKG